MELIGMEWSREWVAREHDRLLRSCYTLFEEGHYQEGLRLAWAFSAMCQETRSHWRTWEKVVDVQADLAKAARDPVAQGRAMLDGAELCANQGDHDQGMTYARRARWVFGRVDADEVWHARAHRALGINLREQGHLDAALREFDAAAQVFARHDRWWWARVQTHKAEILAYIRPPEERVGLLRSVARAFDELGDTDRRDFARVLLAEALGEEGYALRAWLTLQDLHESFVRKGWDWYVARCLRAMGELDSQVLVEQYELCDLVLNPNRARELRNAVRSDVARETNDSGLLSDETELLAVRRQVRQRYQARIQDLLGAYADQARQEVRKGGSPIQRHGTAQAGDWSVRGRTMLLERALAMFDQMGDPRSANEIRLALGRVLVAERGTKEAATVFKRAVRGFEGLGNHWRKARAQRVMVTELFEELMAKNLARGVPLPPRMAGRLMRQLRDHAQDAFETYSELDNHMGRLRAQVLLARVLWARMADQAEVRGHLDQAEEVAHEHGEERIVEEVRRWRRMFFVDHPGHIARQWPIHG